MNKPIFNIERFTRALYFATAAHEAVGQVRKYTGEPYINHPVEVATMLSQFGFDDEVIEAAILHDVLEDTKVTRDTILRMFGGRVYQFVHEVTDISTKGDGNRAKRKAIDRDFLAKASPEGQSIKLADLISNTKSICEHDPSWAEVYLKEKQELMKVLTKGDPQLYKLAQQAIEDGIKRLAQLTNGRRATPQLDK